MCQPARFQFTRQRLKCSRPHVHDVCAEEKGASHKVQPVLGAPFHHTVPHHPLGQHGTIHEAVIGGVVDLCLVQLGLVITSCKMD